MTNIKTVFIFLLINTGCWDFFSIDKSNYSDTDKAFPSDSETEKGGLDIRLQLVSSDDQRIQEFAAYISSSENEIIEIFCSEQEQNINDNLRCISGNELLVSDIAADFSLVIKAKGYHFSQERVSPASLEKENDNLVYVKTLLRLPTYIVTDDYVTGFTADEGERFIENAYRSNTELGSTYSVKFYIDGLDSEPTVYFQNTNKHPIHYDFVNSVLKKPITSVDFWKETYSGQSRTAMAGTVMWYTGLRSFCARLDRTIDAPMVLTFFPSDDLTPEQALKAYILIQERLGFVILNGNSSSFFYLPAGFEQEQSLNNSKAVFVNWAAEWLERKELFEQIDLQIMNPGLAYGVLRIVETPKLEQFPLSFKDIVVLSKLPIQLPIVGGTITEEAQTPLCHVNLMAKNRGTPNIALKDATRTSSILSKEGKLVRFEVKNGTYTLEETTMEEAELYWKSLSKPPVLPDFDIEYAALPLFGEIGFKDSIKVGAKAANLAELHSLLKDTAPKGFAVPFYYYYHHMNSTAVSSAMCEEAGISCEAEGRLADLCVRAEALCRSSVADSLINYTNKLISSSDFIADSALREAALAGLRNHIISGTVNPEFATALDNRAAEVFGKEKIRLRSSTNAEDILGFTGAGLYDSVSAYSYGNKIASKQILKVWASIWNWRAFEEREFWSIDHFSTLMGVAVNEAFVTEAANGVLITQNIADRSLPGMYVNVQIRDIAVTNPEQGFLPEIFSIISGVTDKIQTAHIRYSSLYPDSPILTDNEVYELYLASDKVNKHFSALYEQNPNFFAMDLEFKFLEPNRKLIIKQARPYAE